MTLHKALAFLALIIGLNACHYAGYPKQDLAPMSQSPAITQANTTNTQLKEQPTLLGESLKVALGNVLSKGDLQYYFTTTQYALENTRTNTTSPWVNPKTSVSGAITPLKTYKTADNQYCRDFTQTITIKGQTEQAYGTACRTQSGTWSTQQ